jgi:hypothetical protein
MTLPLHNIKVSIKPSCVDPEIVASLSSVWVRVHGIPVEARKDSFLELISQAIGKLEEVDGQSLAGQGPIRLRVLCPDPSKLNCSISPFFFGKDGKSLVMELESEEDQGGSLPHSPRTDQDIPRGPREDDDDSSGDDDGGSDRDGGAVLPPSVGVAPLLPPLRPRARWSPSLLWSRHLRLAPAAQGWWYSPGVRRLSWCRWTLLAPSALTPWSPLGFLSPSTAPTSVSLALSLLP